MRLYLVQHGESQPESVSPERELTPRGRSDVERLASLLDERDAAELWVIDWMLRPELLAGR